MSLNGVRQQFAELSGRHDLVTDFAGGTYTNNADNIGADFFLDSGQRMLDGKVNPRKLYGWYKIDTASGDYKIKLQQACAIKQVWAMKTGGDRYQLTKEDYNVVRSGYAEAYASISNGEPSIYCPPVMNLSPEQAALTSANYTDQFSNDSEEITFADQDDATTEHYNHHGILLMPPADGVYTISVLARFRSIKLSSDVKTYWTEVHPDLLVLAGMWSMERFFRNTAGVQDYMGTIMNRLMDIDADVVEEEIQDFDSMWG